MAYGKKQFRYIRVGERTYAWQVCFSDDYCHLWLVVTEKDGCFEAAYRLRQRDDRRWIALGGDGFGKVLKLFGGGTFRCPEFAPGGIAKPSGVRELIEWCLRPNPYWEWVDRDGLPIPPGEICPQCGERVSFYPFSNHTTDCKNCGHYFAVRAAAIESTSPR
ncbi:hypothetical protein [Alienimonas chondri]|uniref:hypothetical protein n=1 Tax=Alienimonas chondri TaxID=2681879 RepID=UPI0014895E70|nr:hypothetical protein [Alienimonas chondri]